MEIHRFYGEIIVRPESIEDLPPVEGEASYKGLAYYTEKDAEIFFGRERLTEKLVAQLRETRFLAVVGASGSGKSSLLRAGVAPALRQQNWAVHILTPTADPLGSLATSLTREDLNADTGALKRRLSEEPSALSEVAGKLAARANQVRLLLVVDQFEEAFTLCKEEAARQAFLGCLQAAGAAQGATTVLIGVRADFYDRCLQYEGLRRVLAEQQEPLGPMTEDELLRVIAEPAKRGGWHFVEGLVEQMLEDVGREPGRLPLLSHALRETWERRRGTVMTLAGYRASGGVEGAIAETAEKTLENLPAEQAGLVQNVFLSLTELGEGSEDTRRIADAAELARLGEEGEVATVIERLVRARLITVDEGQVEVAHEALIRRWPRLREWLEENRERLRFERQLARDAQEWERLGQDAGALYRGARLAQALEWAQTKEAMPATLQAFLSASREEADEEERRQKQLERAGLVRKAAYVIGGLALVAVIAAVAAGFFGVSAGQARATSEANALAADEARETAVFETTRAVAAEGTAAFNERDARLAEATATRSLATSEAAQAEIARLNREIRAAELAAESEITLETSPPLALLLAAEAISQTTRFGENRETTAEQSLRLALANSGGRPLAGHGDGVWALAFSPDDRWLATGSNDTAILWDMQDLQSKPSLLAGHEDRVSTLAFSPDGRWLATGRRDNTARLWRLRLGDLLQLACARAGRNIARDEWQTYFPGEDYRCTCSDLPPHYSVLDVVEAGAVALAEGAMCAAAEPAP